MGKKKHDKKAKPKLSKKELKELQKKAAKRERKIDEREKKAAKKALEKSDAMLAAEKKSAKKAAEKSAAKREAAAADAKERAKPLKADEMKAALEADLAAAKERQAEVAADIDAQIAKRVSKKAAEQPSTAERLADMQKTVAAERAKRAANETSVADPEWMADAEKPAKKTKAKKAEPQEAPVEAEPAQAEEAPAQAEFANPSESGQRAEFHENRLGQYIVKRPIDGKEVGYTRVTTFIDALEDKSMLTAWKMRMLLEGVAVAEEQAALSERTMQSPTAKIRELAHRRDVAIAKARKADRKGRLVPGQLATLVDGAWSDFKKAMNELADDLFEVGGGREKAQKGTDIHNLCDIHDREGMQAIDAMLEAGEITPTDHADVTAYARVIRNLGAKVTASELTVVNHAVPIPGEWMRNPKYDKKNPEAEPEMIQKTTGVGGRLDRVLLVKLPEIRDPKTKNVIYPGDSRARRYVADIKTGRVDLGIGKIAQQIRMYAESEAYDLETKETSSHGANRSHGLLIHVPAGTGTATVHLVDLNVGATGNKIVAEVRAFRNAGKKAIALGVDLAAQQQASDAATSSEEAAE